MELHTVWFILIAVLWTGYFFLEGFDFGVGMLLHVLGHTETDRRVMINTIGPVWDGNEVWLLTAGGATFAAFPYWYATLFSGFYLPLFLILIALIFRGVAFEYRGKIDSEAWRARGTSRSPSGRGCRPCSGVWRSPTSSAAYRSTRPATTQALCSPC
jgi:cytochrome d ubiquinol oxidase subunit II